MSDERDPESTGNHHKPLAQGTGQPRVIAMHVSEAAKRRNPGVAYNMLEGREFALRQRSIVEFDVMVVSWMQALNIMDSGVSADEPRPVSPEYRQAQRTQKLLFNLGVGASKAALDAILSHYLPAGFASLRLLTETIIAIRYLQAFPERADLWWRDGLDAKGRRHKSPSARDMHDDIVKARSSRDDERFAMIDQGIEALYSSFGDHSIGDHVTPELIRGMIDEDGIAETYPTDNRGATMFLFGSGCLVLATFLGMLPVMLQFGREEPLDDQSMLDRPGFWPEYAMTIDELLFHHYQLRNAMDRYLESLGSDEPSL